MAPDVSTPAIAPTRRPRVASGDAVAPSAQSEGALTDSLLRMAEELYAQQREAKSRAENGEPPVEQPRADEPGRRRRRDRRGRRIVTLKI